MTSWALIVAGILSALAGIVHSWLGERRILGVLIGDKAARPRVPRNIVRWAWHLTSFAWIVCGVVLSVYAVLPPDRAGRIVIAILGAMLLVNALVCVVAGGIRHVGAPVFLLAGLAALASLV